MIWLLSVVIVLLLVEIGFALIDLVKITRFQAKQVAVLAAEATGQRELLEHMYGELQRAAGYLQHLHARFEE